MKKSVKEYIIREKIERTSNINYNKYIRPIKKYELPGWLSGTWSIIGFMCLFGGIFVFPPILFMIILIGIPSFIYFLFIGIQNYAIERRMVDIASEFIDKIMENKNESAVISSICLKNGISEERARQYVGYGLWVLINRAKEFYPEYTNRVITY